MFGLKKSTILIITIVITVAAVIIASTVIFASGEKKNTPKSCILSTYGNSVALYIDGELNEVFSEIVIDTLPPQDIKQLKYGISFNTVEEAKQAVEDYDG